LGGEFWKIGVGRSLSDAVMSWLRLQTHLESTPHPCICIQSVSAP
jgi:hypothetical protein